MRSVTPETRQLTVLFFSPQGFDPPRTGFHVRCRQFVEAYRAAGCRVVVCTFGPGSGIAGLGDPGRLPPSAREYRHAPDDWSGLTVRPLLRILRLLRRDRLPEWLVTPPAMRSWFRRVVAAERPSLVHLNYSKWAGLLSAVPRECLRVTDLNDLISLNSRMWAAVEVLLSSDPVGVDCRHAERLSDPDFFKRADLRPDPAELRACDRFDVAVAISPTEERAVRAGTTATRVVLAPVTVPVADPGGPHDGPALLIGSDNPFNVQGYLFFARRVLPLVLAAQPEFSLDVVGSLAGRLKPEHGVRLVGPVADLEGAYAAARFAICPVFGGTGEKVKIAEAMAHGLPVVALADAAVGSPLVDRENGAVVPDAQTFADVVLEWWRDQVRCRELGQRAHRTVIAERSPERLAAVARDIVELAAAGQP